MLKNILITEEEYKRSNKNDLILIKCHFCEGDKLRKKSSVQKSLRKNKGDYLFCSVSCFHKFKSQFTNPPSKELLQELVNNNYTETQIGKHINRGADSVGYWLKKHGLKTNHGFSSHKGYSKEYMSHAWDWIKIQEFYNDNHSSSDVCREFNIKESTIRIAQRFKLFKKRSIHESGKIIGWKLKTSNPRQISDETKLKLSAAGKKSQEVYRPHKIIKNKYNYSYACEKLKEKLRILNINFQEEFPPLLHKKRWFSIDIAFPDKKVGIEINGNRHYNKDGTLTDYFQSRHDLIENEGWILYEIKYKKAFNIFYVLQILQKHCIYNFEEILSL